MRWVILGAAGIVALGLGAQPAWAGCTDGACGRVDWTEITAGTPGQPTAAKLHGGYAWEASNSWTDGHPMGGSLLGFVWLSCDSSDGACQTQLQAELAKAGTATPLYFGGRFWVPGVGAVRPPQLYAEGEAGAPMPLPQALLGVAPTNAVVCPTAFALSAPATGADASPTGATGDSGGCGVGGSGSAWAALLVLALLRRRR
ncbi:MAG TPA: hypothetical protein VKE22_26410 [Haliangiales bacterium]|nr:hypothetical protein [Haliangiales bacterium]